MSGGSFNCRYAFLSSTSRRAGGMLRLHAFLSQAILSSILLTGACVATGPGLQSYGSIRTVIDSEQTKAIRVDFPARDDLAICLTLDTSVADGVTDVAAVHLDDAAWVPLESRRIWPMDERGLTVKGPSALKVLFRVLPPSFKLIQGGSARLYDEDVNFIMKVWFKDRVSSAAYGVESEGWASLQGSTFLGCQQERANDAVELKGEHVCWTAFTSDGKRAYRHQFVLMTLHVRELGSKGT